MGMAEIFALKSPKITEAEKRHMEIARTLAGECVVLLENDGVLPLQAKGKIALYGSGARRTVKGGTGSGDVNSRFAVTIEQGLAEAGYEILTGDWMDRYGEKRKKALADYNAWMEEKVKEHPERRFALAFSNPFTEPGPEIILPEDLKTDQTDTAIYVISRNSGEGEDRFCREGDYLLYPEEKESLEVLGKAYAKLIVVLNIGGVMDMTELKSISGIRAILLMSQLGNIGGNVLADILSGEVNPSGKLTDTWAVQYEDYPSSATFSHNDKDVDDEYYSEGIYVGYRYFDTFGVDVVYPFGYGKSYTDFSLNTLQVVQKEDRIRVSVQVTNVGEKYSGREVVQVYASAPEGELAKPYQELKGFTKTSLLSPGESETLTVDFAIQDLASYCEKCAAWVLEAGEYLVRVGNCSGNTQVACSLVVEEKKKTKQLKNLFADIPEEVSKLQEISPRTPSGQKEQGEDRMVLDLSQISMEQACYQGTREEYHTDKTEVLKMTDVLSGKCTVEELVSQLSIEEMAEFCVGTLRVDGNSLVGNASHTIPGAAGDTSSICKESRGIKNMILADGPAGLRLQPHFKTTKDGELLPGGEVFGESMAPFDPAYEKEDVDDYYQYCTAIPIGWALAQSWNLALIEKAGDMVGEEMEQFGIDLWLAPAMNIHRNPLCGRNFEYYSEDPLVSGKAAAAITKGVQKHTGKGTCIKHFAVNNQEDNRYFTNSHVSERALREIYLKGFEIAVKESQPLSIMTSYNLLNGVHTANCYDLVQSLARDEWGFAGTVMTDWFTSQEMPMLTGEGRRKYPISASTGCIFAGNDMQMPGCQKNVDDIVKAVKEGCEIDGYRITLGDLQFNTANVIRVVAKTMSV